ncbi:MAG: SHOCT domain-containing protein [Flavobacterium sp.]|nr:SHOCT domain-containing protein [Flavobacterium sp.]
MIYENYYWGMNVIWWFVWVILIFWIFATPYDIPGQRRKKKTPLDILRNRFAAGKITAEEFEERKQIIESL